MSRMAYRFRMDESVEAGVRRIAGEQIDEALAIIRSADLPQERIVHEVRRRCKALRALIRLVRPAFPAFAHENEAFRDIAHALAGARDARVMLDLLDSLAAEDAGGADRRLFARLAKRLAAPKEGTVAIRETLDQCAADLLAARARTSGWVLAADGWDALSGGLSRTVKAARRAMAAMGEAGDAEWSHEWRKHVKYHWHHMRLLRAAGREAADERIALAERLAALLGERHDLDLFVETLTAQPRPSRDAAAIDPLVAKARERAARLQEKAGRIGARLFDEKPRRLAGKWRGRWRRHAAGAAFA